MDEHEKVLMAKIGDNLRRLSVVRGLSVEELAEASTVDREQIELLLEGEGRLLVETLLLLAAALGSTPEVLLDGIAWVPDTWGGEYRVAESPPDDEPGG